MHPNGAMITGVLCGIRVAQVEDPLMQQIRRLDKLVDELAEVDSRRCAFMLLHRKHRRHRIVPGRFTFRRAPRGPAGVAFGVPGQTKVVAVPSTCATSCTQSIPRNCSAHDKRAPLPPYSREAPYAREERSRPSLVDYPKG